MSTVSKIPQNRVSRIAGPSKLPSRILRPTFTNKSVSNFVSSAKLVEKKKESVRSPHHPEVESNSPRCTSSANRSDDIEKVLHCTDNSTVDCNGNKKICEQKKYLLTRNNISDSNTEALAVSPNKHDSKSRTSNLLTDNAKYYEMQKVSTVNCLKETDKKIGFQSDDTPNSVQYSETISIGDVSGAVPNFRSMKPGYFLQKVSALKSSQQKSNGHTEKQSKNYLSGLSKYSAASQKTGQRDVDKSKFGYKFDENAANENDNNITLDQGSASAASSRLGQLKLESRERTKDSSDSVTVIRNTARAEKRKKYLELKNSASNVSSRHTSSNAVTPFGFQKHLPANDVSSEENNLDVQMTRRTHLRKPQLRNAKIARPVVRPKKIPSPITAKPYVAAKSDQSPDRDINTMKTRHTSNTDSNIISDFLNEDFSSIPTVKSNLLSFCNSDTLTEKCSDDQFVDSTTSEESGYSSVTSNVYLDIRTNGVEEGSSLSQSCNAQVGERTFHKEGDTETSSEKQKLSNGQSSYSLSDVLSTELEHDDDGKSAGDMRYCSYIASEDIITFGQYRLQVEGNYSPEEKYGVSEARQIRTSSGSETDITALREIQVSPDCENASNSSAETVIHNTSSPQSCDPNDLSDNQKEDNRNDVEFPYTITDIERQIVTSSGSNSDVIDEKETKANIDILLNDGKRSDSQFFSAGDDTLFMSTVRTPETSNKPQGTPSTSSTSKAKKRKTDSLIMSPLIIEETNDKEQAEKAKIGERKNLFAEDDLGENGNVSSDENAERDESLSEFIDLPSLHDSALMIDCNSILEDDNSEDEAEVLESQKKDQHEATTNISTPQTNVINKLLSQGLNGIVSSEKIDSSSTPLTNGCHAVIPKTADGASKNQTSAEDKHRAREDMNNIYRVELGVMKMSLIELYRTLEVEESQKERQIEENKRLQLKNQKLTQMVENLTKELASLKTTQPSPVVSSKETQVDVHRVDASTDTEPIQSRESSTSHWFHTEVSTEVESNIKEASEEIKYLKDLRGDFDKRIRDTEQRLNSALQLLHR